jgi:hypothetical protein
LAEVLGGEALRRLWRGNPDIRPYETPEQTIEKALRRLFVVGGDVIDRHVEVLGHLERDRAVNERDREPLRERRTDHVSSGAICRGQRHQRHRAASKTPRCR